MCIYAERDNDGYWTCPFKVCKYVENISFAELAEMNTDEIDCPVDKW